MLQSVCPVGCLSLEKLNCDSQQGRDLAVRMQQTKISIGPILFLYYEESLVSSNLNSKLFRFHSAHPTVHSVHLTIGLMRNILKQWDIRNTQYVLTCHCYSKMNFLISGHEGLDQI